MGVSAVQTLACFQARRVIDCPSFDERWWHGFAAECAQERPANMNDVDPFAYLKAPLEALAKVHLNQRIDKLVNWVCSQASS